MRIGIDIGGSKIAGILFSEEGSVLSEYRLPIDFSFGGEDIFSSLCQVISHLLEVSKDPTTLKISPYPAASLLSIGLGCPGHIVDGLVIQSPNLPGLNNLPLSLKLEKAFNLPVYLENDAACATFGEFLGGSLKNVSSGALLTLGTGIGGGFVLKGSLLKGASAAAMEIGHIPLHPKGKPCPCGRLGCFEQYGSASAFVVLLKEEAKKDESSLLWTFSNNELGIINGEMGMKAAKLNDKAALKALSIFIQELSLGITSLVNLLDPEIIAIGGGLSSSFDLFGEDLMALVKDQCYAGKEWKGRIVKAELENQAGLLGAAFLHQCG